MPQINLRVPRGCQAGDMVVLVFDRPQGCQMAIPPGWTLDDGDQQTSIHRVIDAHDPGSWITIWLDREPVPQGEKP